MAGSYVTDERTVFREKGDMQDSPECRCDIFVILACGSDKCPLGLVRALAMLDLITRG